MSSASFTHELTMIGTEFLTKITGEVSEATENLKVAGEGIYNKGKDVAKNLAEILVLVGKKEIDPDQAKRIIDRELDAFASLAMAAKEVASQEAAVRFRNALSFAAQAGIAIAKISIALAV